MSYSTGSDWSGKDQAVERVLDNDEFELILMAFLHFYHLDHSNALVHCATVRYSPITFRLGQLLHRFGGTGNEIHDVRVHDGTYDWDHGR